MANPIRKTKTAKGTPIWIVDGRRYNASPSRPQFKSKEAAEEALSAMIAQRGAGLNPGRRDITFGMQAEAYLRNSRELLAGKTLRNYQANLNAHLLADFGKKRIVDVTTREIKSYLASKREGHKVVRVAYQAEGRERIATIPVAKFEAATMRKLDPEKLHKLGAASVAQLRALLSVVFQSAVDDGLISVNPVAAARVGTRGRKARAESSLAIPKERPLTQAQAETILNWARERDGEFHDLFFFLLRSGCRPGEARGLKWGDIGEDKILIERSVDDKNEVTPTKTGTRRSVDLSPALKDVLRLRYLKRGKPSPELYVFGNGTPMSVQDVRRQVERAFDECGITGHSLYDTRHGFASLLLQRGANILYVAKQLGHSDPSITLKHYSHFMESEGQRYVDLLDGPAVDSDVEREAAKP